jgi:cysteinyl-tRNA synthetase
MQRLVDSGHAYAADGDVYFDVRSFPAYGELTGQKLDDLQPAADTETDDRKRDPRDFALWKAHKDGEPETASWDTPWGRGRPGWHLECSAMAERYLGPEFDIHGGGLDLRFPHHENERAQAVALGHRFANHWMHHAFVEVEGEKMSKSLGNFTNLLDLIDEADVRAYRLLVLQAHYRTPMDVTKDTIAVAEKTLEGLDGFARRFASVVEAVEPDAAVLARFRERMDDDLDTPNAVAAMFEAEKRANRDDDAAAAAAVFAIAGVLGLELRSAVAEIDTDAMAKARERDEARAAKDYGRSDALRDELQSMGYEVHDTPNGTELRKR